MVGDADPDVVDDASLSQAVAVSGRPKRAREENRRL